MRGFPQRILAVLVGVVVLGAILACPKPGPTPVVNPPDAADAARPPKKVSCSTACDHAETVCSGAGGPCLAACNRISTNDPGYAPCIAVATSCQALGNCDALIRASR